MTIWEISEKADYIADRHRQQQEQWHIYCNSLVQGITLSKARLHHAMSCAPDKELCFVLFGHFQVFVALAEGFATYAGFQEAFHIAGFEPEIVTRVNDIFSMLSLVQAGVGFTLMPGRMKKVYENSVQLLKLAQPYQMQQLIAIVFARNREQDPSLRALAAEGRMYARSLQDSA